MPQTIQVILNGETLQTAHTHLQALLDEMGQKTGRFAVEVDGELIPKSQLANINLTDNIKIEVVQAVGGG